MVEKKKAATPAEDTAGATKAKPAASKAAAKKATAAKKASGAGKAGAATAKKATETASAAKKAAAAKAAPAAKKEDAADKKVAAAAPAAKKTAGAEKKAAAAKKPAKAAAEKPTEAKPEVKAQVEEKAPAAEAVVDAVSAEEPAEPAKPAEVVAEAAEEVARQMDAEKPVEDAKADEPAEVEPAAEEAPAADEAPVAEVAPAAEEDRVVERIAEQVVADYSDVPGVLIAAAECAPLVKVGGMADVVGALPKYLEKVGVDARVIMPFHRQIKERYFADVQHLCDFQASLGWRSQYVGVEKLELDGVIYYFIDNEFYFGGPVYCGGEFEGEQYAFFTRAVMDAIPQLDFDVRILHCNDWHTAMMPLLAKTQYHGGMQEGLRTVLTIHNLHFQGQFSHDFDRDLLRVDDSLATPQFIEHYGCDNMLKAGIVFADKVNTVSPTYSREICEPHLGESLDGVLRTRGGDLWGILNGIDYEEWNPATDVNLPVKYSEKSLWRKEKVRDALLEELGLQPAGPDTAVISMVGRLTPQKGIDLVERVIDELMGEDVRVILLGSGYSGYEDFFRGAEARHKGRLCSYIGYNGELSHRIYAGSDLFLMPSLFEPCGISQLIAMAYGTLPIVRETGGLKDTVTPYNEYTGEGTGFSFANYDAYEMLGVIRWALSVWRDEPVRKRLMKQAMQVDFGFDRCARTYAELYRSLL